MLLVHLDRRKYSLRPTALQSIFHSSAFLCFQWTCVTSDWSFAPVKHEVCLKSWEALPSTSLASTPPSMEHPFHINQKSCTSQPANEPLHSTVCVQKNQEPAVLTLRIREPNPLSGWGPFVSIFASPPYQTLSLYGHVQIGWITPRHNGNDILPTPHDCFTQNELRRKASSRAL